MSKAQLVIKNAVYFVGSTFKNGDIIVNNNTINQIAPAGSFAGTAERVLECTGLLVLPGVIDSHVHFRDPGRCDREDFFSGSAAAASGGVTTVMEMPNVTPPPYSASQLQKRIAIGEEKSLIDFSFYAAAGYNNRDNYNELLACGIRSFKTFLHSPPKGREAEFTGLTAENTGELFAVLQKAAKIDGRFFFHCENDSLIKELEKQLHEQGQEGYNFHYKSRPNVAEAQSVATVIELARATGAKVGICHVSTAEAAELIKRAKADGLDIVAEVCYHHLLFSHADLNRFGPYAKCNPPLRSPENVESLWKYVTDGTIDYIGSDHAPLAATEKQCGEKNIWQAFSGIAGAEAMVTLIVNEWHKRHLCQKLMTRLLSENTAKVFGLYPQKGKIAVGSDGDFTVINPHAPRQLSIEQMYSKAAANNKLFDGLAVSNTICYTVSRGQVVAEDGQVNLNLRGHGQFVKQNWR